MRPKSKRRAAYAICRPCRDDSLGCDAIWRRCEFRPGHSRCVRRIAGRNRGLTWTHSSPTIWGPAATRLRSMMPQGGCWPQSSCRTPPSIRRPAGMNNGPRPGGIRSSKARADFWQVEPSIRTPSGDWRFPDIAWDACPLTATAACCGKARRSGPTRARGNRLSSSSARSTPVNGTEPRATGFLPSTTRCSRFSGIGTTNPKCSAASTR